MSEQEKRPTIARIWRGRTRRELADEYEAYNYEAGIKPLIDKALGVQTLREDHDDETEFVTISYWESVEAMSRFTGDDRPASTIWNETGSFWSSCRSGCRFSRYGPRVGVLAVAVRDPERTGSAYNR